MKLILVGYLCSIQWLLLRFIENGYAQLLVQLSEKTSNLGHLRYEMCLILDRSP